MEPFHSLQRTFDPKYSHYSCDGGGRDSYIKSNNGGLMKEKYKPSPLKDYDLGKYKYHSPAPKVESWGLTYHSDGSGRDHYITFNSGGLYSSFSPRGNINYFKDSLRKPISRSSNDQFIKTTQRWVDNKGRQTLKKNMETVYNVVNRLSPADNKPHRKNIRITL
jgi:hypothetical protein